MKKAALLGCGIVGGGVEIIFRENAANLEKAVGEPVGTRRENLQRSSIRVRFATAAISGSGCMTGP